MRRRDYLETAGGIAATGLLAGCSGDGGGNGASGNGNGGADGSGAEVAATASNIFDPDTVTISTGETVTWNFESPNHNVECDPERHDQAALPDDAEPFTSYDGDNRFETVPQGETYEHTFDVAGEYTYICVPHAGVGMIGTVVVEE